MGAGRARRTGIGVGVGVLRENQPASLRVAKAQSAREMRMADFMSASYQPVAARMQMRAELTRRSSTLSRDLVGRDFEVEPIRIAKINRVRDLVIFEFEIDPAGLQLLLRAKEICAIRPQREMAQADSR